MIIPVSLISILIADNKNITHFLVRDVRHRLSGCDAKVAQDFIISDKSIHYLKYQEHTNNTKIVLPGKWEGNRKKLATYLKGKTMQQYIQVLCS